MRIVYGLRADYQGTVEDPSTGASTPRFLGGVVRLNDHEELNIADALATGDGVITINADDAMAVASLDGYPALLRLSVEDDPQPPPGAPAPDPAVGQASATDTAATDPQPADQAANPAATGQEAIA